MSRYIDANMALKLLSARLPKEAVLQKEIKEILKHRIVCADVQEVKHGKWDAWGEDHCCSECAQWALFDQYEHVEILSKYCPNCGAKMDLEDKS